MEKGKSDKKSRSVFNDGEEPHMRSSQAALDVEDDDEGDEAIEKALRLEEEKAAARQAEKRRKQAEEERKALRDGNREQRKRDEEIEAKKQEQERLEVTANRLIMAAKEKEPSARKESNGKEKSASTGVKKPRFDLDSLRKGIANPALASALANDPNLRASGYSRPELGSSKAKEFTIPKRKLPALTANIPAHFPSSSVANAASSPSPIKDTPQVPSSPHQVHPISRDLRKRLNALNGIRKQGNGRSISLAGLDKVKNDVFTTRRVTTPFRPQENDKSEFQEG